ncbi:MAG: 50S ribosomal protein L25 [Fibrobacterota bacterium]
MQELSLKARRRDGRGKSYCRKIKSEGRIPGVYYGNKQENIPIEFESTDIRAIMRSKNIETVIFDIAVKDDEKSPYKAIIKEMQWHPYKDAIEHIDFTHIDMNIPVRMDMHVTLKGQPTGVKNAGGILQQMTRLITIECLPADIPEEIEIDISGLDIGDSVHVRDLELFDKDKVTVMTSPDEVLAVVTAPKKEEEPSGAEGEEGEEGADAAEGGADEKAVEEKSE